MSGKIIFNDMGRTRYESSLIIQKKTVERKIEDSSYPDVLFFTEHNPVITLGKRGGDEFINRSSDYFKENQPPVVSTNRGGLVTCHMPGQAVLYPVMDLKKLGMGVKDYVYLLMDVISDFLNKYGVCSYQSREYPGVWVNNKKIGNIGLGIKKNISFHGLSLNIINNNSLFDIVTPCGIKDAKVTRLIDETDKAVDMLKVKNDLINSFLKIFDLELMQDDQVR